jgi:hypothetical protein
MAARRVLWVLLCLIAGGPCAFLALEGIGLPIVALVLVSLIVIGRRNNSLAETLIGFGLTYAIEVFRFAVSGLAFAVQRQDPGAAAYFAAHLAIAAAIPVSGCWIVLTREGRTRGLRQGDVATDDR